MIQIQVNTDEFQKIKNLLPDICPEVFFELKCQDHNLVNFGICDNAPCIVEFDLSIDDFYEILDLLNDLEIDAFNTNSGMDPEADDYAYKKYLKYGCLYNILYNARVL